jgi:hypothetical protein
LFERGKKDLLNALTSSSIILTGDRCNLARGDDESIGRNTGKHDDGGDTSSQPARVSPVWDYTLPNVVAVVSNYLLLFAMLSPLSHVNPNARHYNEATVS